MIPPTKKRLRSEWHSQRSQIRTDADLLRAHLTILRGQNVRLDVALAAFRDVIPELLRKVHWRLKRDGVFQATRGRPRH
jgi:hypothetical protein